jgi:hypothetical protein
MVRMQDDFNGVVETCKMFVDGVVDHFPDAVMKCRTVVRVAKVHSRSFSYGFKPFEHLNAACVIIFAHGIAFLGKKWGAAGRFEFEKFTLYSFKIY